MNTNRRNTQRFNIKIPVRFQRLDLLDSMEHTVVSSNISEGGVYFRSEVALRVGTPVQVFLNMPEQISGKPSGRRCYQGSVVRVDRNEEWGKVRGVSVAFRFCDAMGLARFEPVERLPARAA